MSMYVLQARTGRERDICAELNRQGFTASAPREIRLERKGGVWREQPRVLMPGYVFVETELTDAVYYQICAIPNVLRFVQPLLPLPDAEAALIRFWSGGDMEPSTITFTEGCGVRVIAGPLRGREGSIIEINRRRKRVTIEVSIHGQPRKVTLSAEFIVPQG